MVGGFGSLDYLRLKNSELSLTAIVSLPHGGKVTWVGGVTEWWRDGQREKRIA